MNQQPRFQKIFSAMLKGAAFYLYYICIGQGSREPQSSVFTSAYYFFIEIPIGGWAVKDSWVAAWARPCALWRTSPHGSPE